MVAVSIKILGGLREYFLEPEFTVELPDGALYRDLLSDMERRLDMKRGQPYWNSEKKTFRGPVIVSLDGVVIWNGDVPLKHGQHITITRLVFGG